MRPAKTWPHCPHTFTIWAPRHCMAMRTQPALHNHNHMADPLHSDKDADTQSLPDSNDVATQLHENHLSPELLHGEDDMATHLPRDDDMAAMTGLSQRHLSMFLFLI